MKMVIVNELSRMLSALVRDMKPFVIRRQLLLTIALRVMRPNVFLTGCSSKSIYIALLKITTLLHQYRLANAANSPVHLCINSA